MNIVGYTYEAGLHCPDCAKERFGLEDHGKWVREDATDREGNEVHPLFSWDLEQPDHCETCMAEIS